MSSLSKVNAFLYRKAKLEHPDLSAKEIAKLVRQWRKQYLPKTS